MGSNTQIKKLCQAGPGSVAKKSQVLDKLEMNKTLLGGYYYLFQAMHTSGCRVSEALSIKASDISENGNVLIKGKKGSKDRICYIPILLEWLPRRWYKSDIMFNNMNRFTAYRELKRLGIGKLKKGRTNMSVTHAFRDDFVKDLRTTKAGNRTLSNTVGHKSTKSTEFYGKD